MERIKFLLQNNFLVSIRLFFEFFSLYKKLTKHLGASSTHKNQLKTEADLFIRIHSIEKGLALPNPRPGFGKEKILNIFFLVEKYKNKYGITSFLFEIKPILDAYFRFNQDINNLDEELFEKYKIVFEDIKKCEVDAGGIINITKKQIEEATNFNYSNFIHTRYSVRDFSEKDVSKQDILKALDLAKKSPSACNRQPWSVYVFKNKDIKETLLKWQSGNNGFSEKINSVILICCNLNYYFIHESNLPYVDGGLYAMNLINAFHSLRIGTIPLTMAMMSYKMKYIYKDLKIPENEVPILLIGIGHLKDSFPVAISHRKDIETYVKFIE